MPARQRVWPMSAPGSQRRDYRIGRPGLARDIFRPDPPPRLPVSPPSQVRPEPASVSASHTHIRVGRAEAVRPDARRRTGKRPAECWRPRGPTPQWRGEDLRAELRLGGDRRRSRSDSRSLPPARDSLADRLEDWRREDWRRAMRVCRGSGLSRVGRAGAVMPFLTVAPTLLVRLP